MSTTKRDRRLDGGETDAGMTCGPFRNSVLDVKEAIGRARDYLDWVFSDENVSEIRLEEVSFDRDEQSWLITFGLLRPGVRAQQSVLSAALGPLPLKRSYKIVQIPDDQTVPPSIRIRELAEE